MVRLVAILSLVFGAVVLLLYLHLLGKGPFASLEERHRREMKDRDETPEHAEPITFAEFGALPRGLTVAEYSGVERRAVTMEGWVQRMLRASDADFHLELCASPRTADSPDTLYATAEITPVWRGAPSGPGAAARGWTYERLVEAFRPNNSGWPTAWDAGPARVRLTGWLMFDSTYAPRVVTRRGRRDPRITPWEVHPVTRIERWDDACAAWAEVPR